MWLNEKCIVNKISILDNHGQKVEKRASDVVQKQTEEAEQLQINNFYVIYGIQREDSVSCWYQHTESTRELKNLC